MVIEMASTFLLVEHVIDHFTTPAADLDQQIVDHGRLAARRRRRASPPASRRRGCAPTSREQIGALQLRAQVAKEILANLQHVEQVLDAFARDPAKRATLAELQPYLRQIHGALVVLELRRAPPRSEVSGRVTAEGSGIKVDRLRKPRRTSIRTCLY